MKSQEGFDIEEDVIGSHGSDVLRVITRWSRNSEGCYTKLRDYTRTAILDAMDEKPLIDLARLKTDMAECVARTSGRKFSLKVTGGKNPDFYRNFVNNGQDRRMSAEIFVGIAFALGKTPNDYVNVMAPDHPMPSVTVLTSTFGVLLDSVGIDPYENGRAHKLALQFPDALKRLEALHADALTESDLTLGEVSPDVLANPRLI